MTGYLGRLAARVAGPARPVGSVMAAPVARPPAGAATATDPFVPPAIADAVESAMPTAGPPVERSRPVGPGVQAPRADASVVAPVDSRPAPRRAASEPMALDASAMRESEPEEIRSPRTPRRQRAVRPGRNLSDDGIEPKLAATAPRASAEPARPAVSMRPDVPAPATTGRGTETVESRGTRSSEPVRVAVPLDEQTLRPKDNAAPQQPRPIAVPLIAHPNGGEALRPAPAAEAGRRRPQREAERRPKVELSIGSITIEVQPAAAAPSPPPRERPSRRHVDPAGGFDSARRLSRLYVRGV